MFGSLTKKFASNKTPKTGKPRRFIINNFSKNIDKVLMV